MPGLITLPHFVQIEHPIELKGKILILQTTPPYMIGQVWKFDTSGKLMGFTLNAGNSLIVSFEEYRLLITEYGQLQDITISYDDRRQALEGMRDFYTDNRINTFPHGFTRYKK